MQMHCHNHSKSDSNNENQESLCCEVSSRTSFNDNLDHLTIAMKEIAQQKFLAIKAKDSELNEMIILKQINYLKMQQRRKKLHLKVHNTRYLM